MAGQLIIHADDFGETEEITKGIWEAINAGAITSTTIMANMPGTEFALGLARDCQVNVSFGVHLNLCEGVPLTPCRTLMGPDDRFVRTRELALRALGGKLDGRQIETEVEAQAARIRDAGIRISHFDGHKHLHQLPIVCGRVARMARRFDVQRIRCAITRRPLGLRRPSTVVREFLGYLAAREFERQGLRFPSRIVDLQAIMKDVGAATGIMVDSNTVEIFCHPGTRQAGAQKPGSCDRASELDFLLSDCWRGLLTMTGMRVGTYWEL